MKSRQPSSQDGFRRPGQAYNNGYQPAGQMATLETSGDQLLEQKNIYKQLKSAALDKMAKEEYQPAIFAKALNYRNERSYMKKIQNSYKEIDLFANTDELRYFGLGPYFYIQFFRRLVWLFFILTLTQSICIYINFKGVGLDNYSQSFSSYLIKSTLGNYSGSIITNGYDGYIVGLLPFVSYVALFLFYIIWKVHFFKTISQQEDDRKDVKPEKFTIQIQGLPEQYVHEEDLHRFFTAFGPIYEVSVVRNYENNLAYFRELDELEEEIKEEELQLVMGGDQSNRKEIANKKKEKAKLEQQLNSMHIRPTTVSAYVHFQFEKSKAECLSYFNEHYLFDTCSHACMRSCCCCCVDKPDERAMFHNKTLLVSNEHPPAPEDINWQSYDLTCCGNILRLIFSILIILLFLCLSCAIVGVCGVYISSHSNNCDGVNTSAFNAVTVTATNNQTLIRCYCNANLVASFTDESISTACSSYLKDIYIEQAIQYVILITEAITNFIFGFIVDKLVNCMRPFSKASGLYTKTAIYTIFLVFNSILIPVLIYADIFGFQPSSYVSFLTIISTDITNFLKVNDLSFYPSFTPVWYRNVSPLFTNYLIFNTIVVWLVYMFYRCCCISKDELQDDQRKILQKSMNKKITDFKLEVYKEASNLYLILVMACLLHAGIPVVIPLAFLNILSRYITNRSLLQGHSSKIDGLSQDLSSMTLLIFPFMLVLFPLVACWMIVQNFYIYPNGLPTTFHFLDFLKGHFTELDKQVFLPFYILTSAVALVEIVLYYTIIKFCACVCSMCYQKKEIRYHSRPFGEYTKSLNVLCSFNIRNNDDMRNTILHLEKYLISHQK